MDSKLPFRANSIKKGIAPNRSDSDNCPPAKRARSSGENIASASPLGTVGKPYRGCSHQNQRCIEHPSQVTDFYPDTLPQNQERCWGRRKAEEKEEETKQLAFPPGKNGPVPEEGDEHGDAHGSGAVRWSLRGVPKRGRTKGKG